MEYRCLHGVSLPTWIIVAYMEYRDYASVLKISIIIFDRQYAHYLKFHTTCWGGGVIGWWGVGALGWWGGKMVGCWGVGVVGWFGVGVVGCWGVGVVG